MAGAVIGRDGECTEIGRTRGPVEGQAVAGIAAETGCAMTLFAVFPDLLKPGESSSPAPLPNFGCGSTSSLATLSQTEQLEDCLSFLLAPSIRHLYCFSAKSLPTRSSCYRCSFFHDIGAAVVDNHLLDFRNSHTCV